MKISVIIVTRNRAEKLHRALNSLSDQTVAPSEVVVVDNHSEDETPVVVEDFKSKLPIIYTYEEWEGIPYARNRGLDTATGDVLAYIDDDCVVDENWVQVVKDFLAKNPDADLVLGQSFVFNRENLIARVSYKLHEKWFSKFIDKDTGEIFNLRCLDTKNVAIRRKIIDKNDLRFRPTFAPYSCGEDTDFGMQMNRAGAVGLHNPKMIVHHEEVDNIKRFLNQAFRRGRATYRNRQVWPEFKLLQKQTVSNLPRLKRWRWELSIFEDKNHLLSLISYGLFRLYLKGSRLGKKYEKKQDEKEI